MYVSIVYLILYVHRYLLRSCHSFIKHPVFDGNKASESEFKKLIKVWDFGQSDLSDQISLGSQAFIS